MVDYYTELLSVIFGTGDEGNQLDDEDMFHFSTSGVELFKLHGNMKQSDRTEVFKTYRKSALGVLLCTVSNYFTFVQVMKINSHQMRTSFLYKYCSVSLLNFRILTLDYFMPGYLGQGSGLPYPVFFCHF